MSYDQTNDAKNFKPEPFKHALKKHVCEQPHQRQPPKQQHAFQGRIGLFAPLDPGAADPFQAAAARSVHDPVW